MKCTWSTEEDCLGRDHLPIIIQSNENTNDDESGSEDTFPKFQYKHLNSPVQYDECLETIESCINTTTIGIDGILYQLLNHLPLSWKQLLHAFYQKCWLNETLPGIWKQSVIIPIVKQDKPRSGVGSYRPSAFASQVGKIMETNILKRVLHYCGQNDIIPVTQACFRKGRFTTDHLIKLTNHIKKQCSRIKNTLATFFDVKKAYDIVWHAKLLYKLKNVRITGMLFQYIKHFLSERCICTRVGKTYSAITNINMSIQQGSINAPILFTILIHDLPKALSK